ncbi:hypothetical protein L6R50_18850 [Myxococcota bacterium]|nr:hypothetical protein [Myxococcota bacterium]
MRLHTIRTRLGSAFALALALGVSFGPGAAEARDQERSPEKVTPEVTPKTPRQVLPPRLHLRDQTRSGRSCAADLQRCKTICRVVHSPGSRLPQTRRSPKLTLRMSEGLDACSARCERRAQQCRRQLRSGTPKGPLGVRPFERKVAKPADD